MKRAIVLTGTEIEEPRSRVLKAGALEAAFDGEALRWVRWNGVEILRGILFLVRTPGWGTPKPQVTGLDIAEGVDEFGIAYRASYGEPGAGLVVKVQFAGSARGELRASAEITAEAPFSTNRTGFVVLHPLAGFAGTQVEVEHASGDRRTLAIPAEISPGQPIFDIRAIAHSPKPGLRILTAFGGDVFEMEDHRNWSDASFKTYSRPIGLPYPYRLDPDAPVSQSVTVTIEDDGVGEADEEHPIEPASDLGRIPVYALPLDRLDDAREALRHAARLAALAPSRILLRFDFTRSDTAGRLGDLAELLRLTGAKLELTVLLPGHDRDDARQRLRGLSSRLRDQGIAASHVAAFAKIDEQSFQPGEARPPHLSEEVLASILPETFPDSVRGGGGPAFFTELNRKRPDPALAEYLTFATTPVVHAADDASVMETLQSLPHILRSASRIACGRPLAVGPVGIGARLNPYGAAPTENASDERTGMAARDPRQRGLFAAAWHVGYLARLAPWNVERFAFGAPTGPFGLIASPQAYSRQGWDELPEGAVYPLYHVAAWVSKAAGAPILEATVEGPLAAVAWNRDGYRHRLIANLGADPLEIDLRGEGGSSGQLLDEHGFDAAILRPDEFAVSRPLPERVHLSAYAVLHVEGRAS